MKKKLIIKFALFIFLISCGKKGDPEYKAKNNNSIFNSIYNEIY